MQKIFAKFDESIFCKIIITFANQYLLPSLLSQPQRVRRTGLNSLANLRSPTIPHNTSRQFPIIAFATSRQIRYSYLPNTFFYHQAVHHFYFEKRKLFPEHIPPPYLLKFISATQSQQGSIGPSKSIHTYMPYRVHEITYSVQCCHECNKR